MSCGVGHRRSLDPLLLWLWRRPVATAPIRPLAWEPPYVTGVALKTKREEVSVVVQWLTNPTRNHEVEGSILGLLSGLRIQRCRELWCSLQKRLGSRVAVTLV